MKLTFLCTYFLGLTFLITINAHGQGSGGGGVGGSQSQSTQTFPGENPAPSTAATPDEAKAKGIVPGTAPTTATTPGGAIPPTAPAPQSKSGNASTPSSVQPTTGDSMSTIVVSGTAQGSVLPNDQTVTSVYGTDLSVQDTPRSVTVVSSELQAQANISDLSDFVKVAPSAYTTDQFGVASVPTIRGQNAEVFINGMQRTTRGDGPPTSFNSVEQSDVVTGPASSILGPTANDGGYVNFVTKQPYFDRFHSDTEFTYGSYDEKLWTEDIGGPIIPNELAYRASYQGDYSGSYYKNEKTNSNDGYVDFAYTPNKDFRVDFNSEIYDGRFNENTGLNRPTQNLINNLQYSTGGVTPFGGTSVGGTGVAPVAPPTNPGTFGGIINSPGTVQISKQDTLVSPSDSDFGKDINAELTETYNASDSLTFINRTYYEYYELRNTELAQLYVNAQQSNIVQDRFEAHIDFDTPVGGGGSDSKSVDPGDDKDAKHLSEISAPLDFKNEIITGVAGKYVNLVGYGDFISSEELNATDLTSGIFPNVNGQHGGVGTGTYPVPGENFFGTPGTSGQPNTTGEEAYEASAFFQHEITFTPQWILLYSGRMDAIVDDLKDPLGNYVGNEAHDTTTQILGTGDVSIDYKPVNWATTYATFDFNESTAGNSAGGFDTYSNGGQSVDYHYKNFLYETGEKFDLLDHKLFTSVDGYYQTHATTTALGATDEIRTLGAELSTTYQPDKHFLVVLNESYLNSTVVNPGAEFTQNVYDAFATNSTGTPGTGVGSPNFLAFKNGHYREAGLPQLLFSGVAAYKFDNGFGLSAGYVITDPIPTTELGNVVIPWQYELDTSVFYVHKGFSAKLSLFNITDQTNFSTGGTLAGTGGDLITVKEPFHMEGTIGYQF